jgi:hypothetical protein
MRMMMRRRKSTIWLVSYTVKNKSHTWDSWPKVYPNLASKVVDLDLVARHMAKKAGYRILESVDNCTRGSRLAVRGVCFSVVPSLWMACSPGLPRGRN